MNKKKKKKSMSRQVVFFYKEKYQIQNTSCKIVFGNKILNYPKKKMS